MKQTLGKTSKIENLAIFLPYFITFFHPWYGISIPNAYFLSRTVIRRCWFSCCEFVSARLLISNFPHVRNFALISFVFRSLWLDSFYRIICRFFRAELFFWSSILKLDLEQCFLDLLFFPQSFHDTFFVSTFYYSTFCHQLIQVWNRMCAGVLRHTPHACSKFPRR